MICLNMENILFIKNWFMLVYGHCRCTQIGKPFSFSIASKLPCVSLVRLGSCWKLTKYGMVLFCSFCLLLSYYYILVPLTVLELQSPFCTRSGRNLQDSACLSLPFWYYHSHFLSSHFCQSKHNQQQWKLSTEKCFLKPSYFGWW